jgi:hypothetical protein
LFKTVGVVLKSEGVVEGDKVVKNATETGADVEVGQVLAEVATADVTENASKITAKEAV